MRRCAVLLATMALAACPELPQPYRHEGLNPMAAPLAPRGVVVRPLDGVPFGPALAEAMVRRLVEEEVAAKVGADSPGATVVEGRVEPEKGGIVIRWQLRTPTRELAAKAPQRVANATWAHPDPRAVAALAAEAVTLLSGPLRGDAPDAVAGPLIAITLTPLRGLPGDGDHALANAMRRALEGAGIRVQEKGGDFTVSGRAIVTPGPGGQDLLDVTWTVAGPDGVERGKAAQQGALPKGRLNQPWGFLAREIAAGGADGVGDILRSATRK